MDTDKINALKDEKGVVLVEFYATWCPHCQKMMPVVADVKALLEGRANVYQFDIDQNNELANELKVNSIPTFIIYKNGVEEWRASGEMDGNVLVSKVEEQL
ncbi:MAG: thioredoxin family protein [Muribaculaceae bacterium]|nr:thioredoxin family protein [Muribaculaceae bacterium]